MSKAVTRSTSVDMTVGDPTKLLLTFMLPTLFGNIFQQFYNIVDTIIAGRYIDPSALAAVGSTGHVTNLFFALGNGLATGIGIVTSQHFGKGDIKSVKKVITNAFILVAATAMTIGVLGAIFAFPVLKYIMGTPEYILSNAAAYMSIICLGFVGTALYNTVSYILKGVGDSKTPLFFLIISSFLNVIMDLVFVLVFDMGVVGLAVATITAQALSALSSMTFAFLKNPVFKLEKADFGFDKDIVVKCFTLGGSMALQSGLIALSFVVLQRVINSFDYIIVAAFTTTSKIENLVNLQFKALSDSLSSYTGQNFGARKGDRVKEGYKRGMTMMLIYAIVMIPVMLLFSGSIVSIFVKGEGADKIIYYGGTAMKILSMFYLPLGTIYVCRGILNGAGDALFPALSGAAEMVGRVVFPLALCSIPFLGEWGLWVSTGITWTIVGSTAFARYHSKDWRKGLF
ncbi:MATE family efflux transporter [Butyrivibrio proteoclasticus]|uniref:MATE family efflux transporter n=1 Tax=Butyrivibrio proteoclasticus TaxID=43305 RepID=UPI000685A451|nr:MATE family efflux transporter [Butyrivibrio proteoclasticus]